VLLRRARRGAHGAASRAILPREGGLPALPRTGGPRQRTEAELLAAAFHGTGLVQDTGLTPAEPAAADRYRICRLYDERETVADRLRIIAQLMAREDFLAFLPTIQLFIDRHPPEQLAGEERGLFEEIRRSDAARDELLRIVHELDVSALQLELTHFARHLGWLSPEAFRAVTVAAAHELLHRPLTTEVVDVMCEIPRHESLRNEFGADDLPPALFEHPEGIRLVDCLSPSDPRVRRLSERWPPAIRAGARSASAASSSNSASASASEPSSGTSVARGPAATGNAGRPSCGITSRGRATSCRPTISGSARSSCSSSSTLGDARSSTPQ